MIIIFVDITDEKKRLRKQYLSLRKSLLRETISYSSHAVCERIISEHVYGAADIIAAYMSVNNEVMLDVLIKESLEKGKEVYLPVTYKNGAMELARFFGDSEELHISEFGILEPVCGERLDVLEELKNGRNILMIMPGVVFDYKRNRIGYGGGYYDRYLNGIYECRKGNGFKGTITTMAAGYECQLADELPSDICDIKPDMVITEKRIIL